MSPDCTLLEARSCISRCIDSLCTIHLLVVGRDDANVGGADGVAPHIAQRLGVLDNLSGRGFGWAPSRKSTGAGPEAQVRLHCMRKALMREVACIISMPLNQLTV